MVSLRDSTPPSEVQEEFYQARKKLGDEAQKLPAGVIGPVINDEYADVTFALFALKAKGSHSACLRAMRNRCVSSCCTCPA
jgi:multidrug efflux pump subunit AcrB